MGSDISLQWQIDELRKHLERTAAEHGYNFRHPNVVTVSKELDVLIVMFQKQDHEISPPYVTRLEG